MKVDFNFNKLILKIQKPSGLLLELRVQCSASIYGGFAAVEVSLQEALG